MPLDQYLFFQHSCLKLVHKSRERNEIMFRLLDDSGAGPPEYSQNFLVDLATGKLRKYGWARDRYE